MFGDSLSDAGNDWLGTLGAEPKSPPYYKGHFSNGLTWVEDLAVALKLGTLKLLARRRQRLRIRRGKSGQTMVHALSTTPPDLPFQIAEFKAQVSQPAKGALYVLWIGSNDLFDVLGHTPALTEVQVDKTLSEIVANEIAAIRALRAFGAKNLLGAAPPDLGHVPAIRQRAARPPPPAARSPRRSTRRSPPPCRRRHPNSASS